MLVKTDVDSFHKSPSDSPNNNIALARFLEVVNQIEGDVYTVQGLQQQHKHADVCSTQQAPDGQVLTSRQSRVSFNGEVCYEPLRAVVTEPKGMLVRRRLSLPGQAEQSEDSFQRMMVLATAAEAEDGVGSGGSLPQQQLQQGGSHQQLTVQARLAARRGASCTDLHCRNKTGGFSFEG